jgi:uncharacterized metal-binding protein YceD (DUF177 family)
MTEMPRPVSLTRIGTAGLTVRVEATPEERGAIAERMKIPAVQSLECEFQLSVEDDNVSVRASGLLRADVTRVCVVSAEDFGTLVEDEFEIRFVPEGAENPDPDPEYPDEIPYQFGTIDLGEATLEQLALALDPYPRIDGATILEIEDGDDESPFSVLARRAEVDRTKH